MSSDAFVDISETIGALQIGSLFGIFLFGVVSLQAYNYYVTYEEDRLSNKVLVALVWILEAGHTVGVSFDVYRSTITFYGRPDLLGRFEGIWAVIICGGGITLLVQAYFARRLMKLFPFPYKYLGHACIAISFLRFCASVYLTVVGHTAADLNQYVAKVGWLIATTFIVSASVDVIVAVSMLYFLVEQRASGMDRMSGLLDRLITYTISSGLLTSLAAVALVICLKTMPKSFITVVWLGLYTFVAKLYSNSLLSALNVRREMREEVLRDAYFGRRKTSVLESASYFHDRDLPASPAISIGPITDREMNGNPELYYNKSKLHPVTNLSIYRISESEEEA